MATNLTPSLVRNILRNKFSKDLDKFEIIKAISLFAQNNQIGQELVLRLLSRRDDFIGYKPIIDSLIRRVGLYPYLKQVGLYVNHHLNNLLLLQNINMVILSATFLMHFSQSFLP